MSLQKKSKDSVVSLPVSLREFYQGKTKRLAITKKVLCSECQGRGVRDKETSSSPVCTPCEGTGVTVTLRSLGDGIQQQLQTQCSRCEGSGIGRVEGQHRCKECLGSRLTSSKVVVEIQIRPGMSENDKITLVGHGDQLPDHEPGDLILQLARKEPVDFVEQRFQRRGTDLHLRETLNLGEALCGYKKYIQHLDGRWLLVQSPPHTITKPGDIHFVAGEGMPSSSVSGQRGHLIITFDLQLPSRYDELSEEVREKLPRLFPAPPPPAPEEMASAPLICSATIGSEDTRTHYDDQPESDPQPTCAQQ